MLEAVTARIGGQVTTSIATRLLVLGRLVPPPSVPGRGRLATPDDGALLTRWRLAFADEVADAVAAGPETGPGRVGFARAEVDEATAAGMLWVWHDDLDRPVCMVGARPPAYGVSRVGPVYTPVAARRHGYAAATTALASAQLLRAGARQLCLYTDLANPTSSGVYQRIGYRPVLDMANLRIDTG